MFTGGFGDGEAHNTPERKTHHHEHTTPRTTAADREQKVDTDVDRKSRDFAGDDDVRQSPRESLSVASVCSISLVFVR